MRQSPRYTVCHDHSDILAAFRRLTESSSTPGHHAHLDARGSPRVSRDGLDFAYPIGEREVYTRSHSEAPIASTKRYRSASVQFLSLIVLIVVHGTGTRAVLLAQGKTELEMKPRVSLGVVIDTSAHQKKVIEFEREVVNSLADGFADLATESFVVRYADEVEILQGWSPLDTGLKTVSRRVELDPHSGKNGRTLLYDAVNVGLLKFDTGNSANSKVLIIIGEGNDAGSLARYSQIKKHAKSANVQCFVLLVAGHNLMGGRVRHFGFDLYDLASATKGKAFDVGDSRKNLDKAIKGVLKRIGQ